MSQPTNLVSNGPVTIKKSSSKPKPDATLSQAANIISGFSGQSVKQSIKQLTNSTSKSKKRVSIKPDAIKLEEDAEKSSKKRKRAAPESSSDDDEEEEVKPTKSTVQTISKQTINQIVKPSKFNRAEVSQIDSLFSSIDSSFKSAPLSQTITQTLEQSDDQPLWLFSYPAANFDYEAFSKLDLNISSKPSKSNNQAVSQTNPKQVGEFEIKGIKYEIIEGDLIETSDLITLFPVAKKGELTLGRPFARILHINQTVNQPNTQTLVDMPSIESVTFKPVIPPTPSEKLKINFLPIGANISEADQLSGERRGRSFKPVAYESDKKSKSDKPEKKKRKSDGMTDSPQTIVKSEKKKKDKKASKH